jgi:hypothetical protein
MWLVDLVGVAITVIVMKRCLHLLLETLGQLLLL